MMFTRKATLAATLAAIMTLAPTAAGAVVLNIPEQTMAGALKSLSEQAKVQIIFSPDAVEGKRAPAISGDLTPGQALQKILGNSGLGYKANGEGTFAVQAQNNASPKADYMLDEVTVTATRTERKISDVPASVSVLTAKTLATKNRQNINEALRDMEGLDINNQPGVAHQVFPIIRGVGGSFAGSSTQVLVDGMAHDSVVSSVMGRGGLNFMAMQDIEQVEVVRGPVSALYGPSTIGGVINVIPKRWKGEAGVEVNGSYGTHNTQTIGVAAGTSKDNFDVRLSVYDAKSDGYKSKPVADQWGGYDLGGRDWKDNKIGLMTGFRPADNHEVTFDFQQYETRSAGSYGGRPNDRQNTDGQSATLGYRFDMSADTNIKANFRSVNLKQKYTFDKWEWNDLANNLDLAYYGGRTSNSTFFQVLVDTRPVAGNQLTAGYSHDTGEHEQSGASVGGATWVTGSKSKVDALFVQDEHKFGSLALTGGARYDRINLSPITDGGVPVNGSSSVANVFNPRLGARYHLTDSTSFYASAGTAYLPATNSFKFVQPSTTRVDNPGLKPETSTSYEIGMNNRLGWGALRTSLYHTDYKDKITFGTDPASGKRQWQNIAVTKVNGVEIAYQGNLGNGWLPYTNFSYTKAENQAKAGAVFTQATRVAPRKLNLGVTYEPNSRWSATLNGRAVSGLYFNNLTAAQRSGGYFMTDAKVSAKLPLTGEKWEAFIAGNNLTDKKYQPFNIGEWSDGRTFTIGIDGKF
ncbi:MAG: TonB-dependent receptor [Gallionella sp.]|nr:TonB-dependent receptor [Gallionella sp.]